MSTLYQQIIEDMLDAHVEKVSVTFSIRPDSLAFADDIATELGITRPELFRRCIDHGCEQINAEMKKGKK